MAIFQTPSPLHSRVRNHILKMIEDGELSPGDKIPSEDSLTQLFNTSRTTIRNALLSLEQDGVVIRRQGIGTFISPYPIQLTNRIDELVSIPKMLAGTGHTPSVSNLEIDLCQGPSDGHQILDIPDEKEIYFVCRLYRADGRPAIYIQEYIRPFYEAALPDWDDFSGDMVEFIEQESRVKIDHVYARIKIAQTPADIAKILDVKPGLPLLMMMHTAYSVEGQPVSYSQSYHRSDFVNYDVVRKRR